MKMIALFMAAALFSSPAFGQMENSPNYEDPAYVQYGDPLPINPLLPISSKEVVTREMAVWDKAPPTLDGRLVPYEPLGDYLSGGASGLCAAVDGKRTLDENGIAMMFIMDKKTEQGASYYHPVLSAQCGLNAYNMYLQGEPTKDVVAGYADNLISLQDDRGAFPYPFPFYYYLTKEELPVGWVSGMAQGQALSLFARAYSLTHNEKYLVAGQKALAFMTVPTSEGGVFVTLGALNPQWDKDIFFEEYVSSPPNYTLNGYIFALLGVYDWSRLAGAEAFGGKDAVSLFQRGISTVEKILPYYDLDGITAYDLGYITHHQPKPHSAARYHAVHIVQLNALYSITGSEIIKKFRDRWLGFVQTAGAH